MDLAHDCFAQTRDKLRILVILKGIPPLAKGPVGMTVAHILDTLNPILNSLILDIPRYTLFLATAPGNFNYRIFKAKKYPDLALDLKFGDFRAVGAVGEILFMNRLIIFS